MKVLDGGIGNVQGFLSAAKHAGIKYKNNDLAVLYSQNPCVAAGVFTQNQIKGAPLYITMENLADNSAQAIVINSGNSNVATGQLGLDNAHKMAEIAAQELDVKSSDVLVASTGVIGVQLPIDKVQRGLKGIKSELSKSSDFAGAIMTTDTFKKEICVQADGFMIAGAAKGSGMIEPNMATMLAFLVTDADVEAQQLQQSLKSSVDKSFNMTSVDTDTSTSDMVILMASGRAGQINLDNFQEALDLACLELTKMIARDGEGATKLITCEVNSASSQKDAKAVGKSIINSPLVKTAVYGNDPNWGRLMMAIGKTNAQIEPGKIDIKINQKPVVKDGFAAPDYNNDLLSELFKNNQQINIVVELNIGESSATAYGCDMSEDYIKINAEYTT